MVHNFQWDNSSLGFIETATSMKIFFQCICVLSPLSLKLFIVLSSLGLCYRNEYGVVPPVSNMHNPTPKKE